MHTTRITITRVTQARQPDINAELQYLAGTLGLFNPRDRDRSKFRIFIALLRAVRAQRRGLTSDELALALNLTRATVIHHIDSLREAGIVEHGQGVYVLRVDSLAQLVRQIRDDVHKTLTELELLAEKCDNELGL